MTLAEWLRATGTSQVAFATRVGCSPSTISRLTRFETAPEAALVEAIARETGGAVLPNDLFPRAMQAAASAESLAAGGADPAEAA